MISKHAQDAAGGRGSTSLKGPLCFLHVPKSGGTSVHDALVAALPEGSVSEHRGDASAAAAGFPPVDEIPGQDDAPTYSKESILEEMSRSAVVSGHFYLPTLLRIAVPESIASVVREPRARVISFYVFWRLAPGYEDFYPHRPHDYALRPLDEFLSEPLMAPAVDNVVCRMLLHGDPRIPPLDFISPDHYESLGADAIDRMDQLGFVGVLERPQATWEGLSHFFGVRLAPARVNVTASVGVVPDAPPLRKPISDRTLELLEARTAADTLLYTHALMSESTEAEAMRSRNSTFAAQLVLLGDIAGESAASAQSLIRRLAKAESRLVSLADDLRRREEELNARQEAVSRLEADLASHRAWLTGIQGSASWRVTAPLRAAKRRVLGVKSA